MNATLKTIGPWDGAEDVWAPGAVGGGGGGGGGEDAGPRGGGSRADQTAPAPASLRGKPGLAGAGAGQQRARAGTIWDKGGRARVGTNATWAATATLRRDAAARHGGELAGGGGVAPEAAAKGADRVRDKRPRRGKQTSVYLGFGDDSTAPGDHATNDTAV